MNSKKINQIKGITLIALVVTIIILLILAGISIASLTENGLFEKAKLAKEKAQESEKIQNAFLHQYEEQIDSYVRSGDSTSESIYNLSELSSTYNPYGLNGFIKYDKNMEILEINIYYNKINISNLTPILNIGFVNNLPNLNFEGQDIWVPETADYMAGKGLAF